MKEYKITLDLVQTTKNEPIYLKKDDVDSVKFIFEVLNNGEVHDLTGTTSVRFAVQRPSGFSFFQECAITDTENGLCEVVLTNQAYSEIGLNLGELYVTQNGVVQVTRQFEYRALDSILAEGTASSGDGVVYWNDILSKPLTFTPSSHTHTWTEVTEKPLTYEPSVHTHSYNDLLDVPTTFAPTGHNHSIVDVTGLSDELARKLEAIPAEYLTQTEGDGRYELKGEGGATVYPLTGTTDPTGITPDYVGQLYVNTTSTEAFIANSATGNWESISADETGGAGTVTWQDVTEKPLAFTPEAHTHAQADVTGLDTALAGKSDTGHAHTYAEITEKPATFTPEAHTHAQADVTGLDTALAGKSDTGHAHTYAEITEKPETFTPSAHDHTWAEVTEKPLTFTPPIASPSVRGGARVGNGLTMSGEYLTIWDGVGIKTNATTYALDVDKPTLDGWYAKSDQGLSLWKGTQAEYDAIATKDSNTLYFIVG